MISSHFEVVWMTTPATGVPHAAELAASNPNAVSHICETADAADGPAREMAWRNCDRHIRNWWRENRSMVQADEVLFLEYDVLVSLDLTTVFKPMAAGVGLLGAAIYSGVSHGRAWGPFEEARRMPRETGAIACGVAPLAVVMLSRPALDAISAQRWDPVFDADIFCELRLATMVRLMGFRVAAVPLPHVFCGPYAGSVQEPGIYHAIKTGRAES